MAKARGDIGVCYKAVPILSNRHSPLPQSLGSNQLGPLISSNQDNFVKASHPYDGSQDLSHLFPTSGGAWLCTGSETQPLSFFSLPFSANNPYMGSQPSQVKSHTSERTDIHVPLGREVSPQPMVLLSHSGKERKYMLSPTARFKGYRGILPAGALGMSSKRLHVLNNRFPCAWRTDRWHIQTT